MTLAAALLGPLALHAALGIDSTGSGFAITGVRLFDGETIHESTTVIVRDGRIEEVSDEAALSDDMEVIDGAGHTVLPGLIDAHVHTFGQARSDATRLGVTTLLDMFTSPQMLVGADKQRDGLDATDQADLFSAGMLATAEGGHGTQFGVPVEPMEAPEDAEAWVKRRIAEGSDYIKIIVEDGSTHGRNIATLDEATVKALVAAAQRHERMALAHVSTLEDAVMAVRAGVDGLVHVFHDRPASEEFLDLARDRGIFVIPTGIVIGTITGAVDSRPLLDDPDIAPVLSPEQRQTLSQARQDNPDAASTWETVKANIAALHQAGIPLLAGSDAPNPGTAHGISLHQELEILVAAGLDEREALLSATATPARHFRLDDRGCLKPGCRADLLLVAGNPFKDIAATRDIAKVWKNGQPVSTQPPRSGGAGLDRDIHDLLADSEQGRWQAAADNFMGGESSASIHFDEANSLLVEGKLRSAPFPPYSGAMWMPGDMPMQPVDIGERTRLNVVVNSEDGPWQVMVFSGSEGAGRPLMVDMKASESGARLTTDLADHPGVDTANLQAVGVFAVGDSRPVAFRISEAGLR